MFDNCHRFRKALLLSCSCSLTGYCFPIGSSLPPYLPECHPPDLSGYFKHMNFDGQRFSVRQDRKVYQSQCIFGAISIIFLKCP